MVVAGADTPQQFAEGSTTVDARQQQAEEQGKHPAEVPGTLNRGNASDEAGVAGPALQLNRYDIEAGIWQGSVLYLTKAGMQFPVLQLQTAVSLQGRFAYAGFLPQQKKHNCTTHITQACCHLAMLFKHANHFRAPIHVVMNKSRCSLKAMLHCDQLCLSSQAFLPSLIAAAAIFALSIGHAVTALLL